jgi:hypothetical protein
MAIADIKAKYGNGKSREVLNRAVRGELIGGNECLDALADADQLLAKLQAYNLPGQDDARKALDALRRIAEAMRDEIATRYDLKSVREP